MVVFCRIPFYFLPLRRTLKTHLYCFETYGKHPVIFVNVDYGIPVFWLKKIPIHAVIFHTSFLVMRWTPKLFAQKTKNLDFIKTLSCPKIALPQDEFIHTQILVNFFNAVGITHVYSCAMANEWENIYPGLQAQGVNFHTVLTGYIDTEDIKIAQDCMSISARPIDIGYRTQHTPLWLGQHGALKIKIAEETKDLAHRLGLTIDISTDLKDVVSGPKWLEFLASCRAVIGVEGGASIVDRDGSLRERIEEIEKTTKDQEKTKLCEGILEKYEGNLNLKALSPRHFEACLTRTYQILIEGAYNGVLKAHAHYFPVKKDFSNLAQALESLQDQAHVQQVTEQAYQDVVSSGRYTYKKFVEFIEETAFQISPQETKKENFLLSSFALFILRVRNGLAEGCNQLLGWVFRRLSLKAKEKGIFWLKYIFHKLT